MIESVILFTIFTILFFPGGIEFIAPGIYNFAFSIKIPAAVSFIILELVRYGKIKINWVAIWTIIFYSYLLVVSLINDVAYNLVIKEFIVVFAVIISLNLHVNNLPKVISPLLASLEWQIYLNFFFLMTIPGGMYVEEISGNWSCWLLGYDNGWNYVFFPALFLAIIQYYYSKNVPRFLLLIICMQYQVFKRWSIMCGLGFVVFDILFLLEMVKNNKRNRIFNIRNYLIIGIGLIVAIIFFRNPIFEALHVTQIAGKDLLTMSNRTVIWKKAVQFFLEKPLFGYGRVVAQDVALKYYHNADAVHAHDMLLELLFRGGIVLLAVYLWLLFKIVKKMMSVEKNRITKILSIAYFTVFIMMLTQVYLQPLSMIMILLGAYTEYMVPRQKLSRMKTFKLSKNR